jgi:pectate lyase
MHHGIILLLGLMGWSSSAASALPSDLLGKPDEWFRSDAGKTTTAHVISWQSERGDWPKNQDHTQKRFTGDRGKLKGTFDNGATTDELRFLARAFRATGDDDTRAAFLRGLDHILGSQYANGGWPQFSPPGKDYHRHITFNDHSMIRLMEFLREVATSSDDGLIDAARRIAMEKAFSRGVECILKCQVVIGGTATVWCAQHDEVTLAPAMARSYELPSLSGSESAGILRFLMTIEKPSPKVIRAVEAGVDWFETHKIEGIRIEKADDDRKVVRDPKAPAIWARFYDLETRQPFFCDRDGVKKPALADIGRERRTGYAWYGNWGDAVAKAYAKWPHRRR